MEENLTAITRYAPGQLAIPSAQQPIIAPPTESLWDVLWRRRWIIIGTAAAGTFVAILYLLLATRLYTSTAKLYVERNEPRILGDAQGLTVLSGSYLYTQKALIESLPILQKAGDDPDVRRMRTLEGGSPTGYLRRNLLVEVGRQDDVISISLDGLDPQETAVLVNRVVQAYIEHQSAQKLSTASGVLRILSDEKTRQEAELAKKTAAMLEFVKTNGTWSMENEHNNVVIQRLNKLSEALTNAQVDAMNARAAFEAASAVRDDPQKVKNLAEAEQARGTMVAIGKSSEELQAQLNEAELRLAVLQRQYPSAHPLVLNANAYIKQLRLKIGDQDQLFAQEYLSAVQQRFEAAKRKEQVFQESFDQEQQVAFGMNARAAEYARLNADVKRTEKLLEMLDTRIKELSITEQGGVMNVQVLEEARPAEGPSHPRKTRVLGGAGVLSLMAGVVLALMRERTDQRVHSAEEVVRGLGIPVLGVVPHIGSGQNLAARGQTMHRDPLSEAAEAIRTIRTAVHFGMPDGRARTLLVTSPAPGDGKTALASSLAIAMAQAGRRTLLLDADFRKPSVHRIFELTDGIGLSSALTGSEPLEKAVKSTAINRLDVLPGGPIPPNPAELLSSSAFSQLLDQLADNYDCILVDSPPVLPVADARILAARCDGTLLVLRAEKSTRRNTAQARDVLLSMGARLMGAIVNDVRRKESGAYYGSYGYYEYGREEGKNGDWAASAAGRWLPGGAGSESRRA